MIFLHGLRCCGKHYELSPPVNRPWVRSIGHDCHHGNDGAGRFCCGTVGIRHAYGSLHLLCTVYGVCTDFLFSWKYRCIFFPDFPEKKHQYESTIPTTADFEPWPCFKLTGWHVWRATFDLHCQEWLVGRAGAILRPAHQQLPATRISISSDVNIFSFYKARHCMAYVVQECTTHCTT